MAGEPAAGGLPDGRHPLDERLRVLEGHVEEILDGFLLVERRTAKHEEEIRSLTAQLCETTEAIRSILAARLRRDEEREQDRALMLRMVRHAAVFVTLYLAGCAAIFWWWSRGDVPVTLDLRGLIPPYHSTQFPGAPGGGSQP